MGCVMLIGTIPSVHLLLPMAQESMEACFQHFDQQDQKELRHDQWLKIMENTPANNFFPQWVMGASEPSVSFMGSVNTTWGP